MRIKILLIAISCFAINVNACLPLSPASALVGRIANIQQGGKLPTPNQSPNTFTLKLTDYSWVFRTWKQWLMLPLANSFVGNFATKNFAPNDIIVALADYQNGGKPHDYTVYTMAKLTCQNDKLLLQKPVVVPLSWNREKGRCGIGKNYAGILDGFMDNDQAYYLAKLQQKYPTCRALENAFPKTK
ncbi:MULTISPECIES: hypothetical protein [unclassified Moraxella]|uniref:hypothetical protein n=1 Tax=unclassified Moraxella TaxID=2685852 RepID=UPI003AF7408F